MSNEEEPVLERRTNAGFIIRFELLGVLGAIIIQTLTAVWWGSAVSTKLDYTQQAITELKSNVDARTTDRYTAKDAERDLGAINTRISSNDQRITFLERRNAKL